MTVKLILTDIEGTTSSVRFVHDVLFPYAADNLPEFIRTHAKSADVAAQLQATAELAKADGMNVDADDTDALIDMLLGWIKADRKATPLKALQGMIWAQGYEDGAYFAHMYPDATRFLRVWHKQNIPLYVYSSGSIHAQKLFFKHSEDGDLLPLFSGHFDTTVGAKREVASYERIALELAAKHAVAPSEVLFLSDIVEELDAARAAGMQTVWLVREGELPVDAAHPAVRSFADIKF